MLFNLKRKRVMVVGTAPLCMVPTQCHSLKDRTGSMKRRTMRLGRIQIYGVDPEALNNNLRLGCWKANPPKPGKKYIPNNARFQVRAPDTKEGLVPIFGDYVLSEFLEAYSEKKGGRKKYTRPLFGWTYSKWVAVFDILFVIDTTPESRMLMDSVVEMGARFGLVNRKIAAPSLFTLYREGPLDIPVKYRAPAVRLYKEEPVALL